MERIFNLAVHDTVAHLSNTFLKIDCATFDVLETTDRLVGIGFVFMPQVKFVGDRLETLLLRDSKLCTSRCANRAGCNYLNYDESSSSCTLFNTVDGAVKGSESDNAGMTHQTCGDSYESITITNTVQFMISLSAKIFSKEL